MDSYKETFETWNKIASLYEDKFMHLDIYNETYQFVCDTVTQKNAKILEIGCGPGNITHYLLKIRPNFNITGIDIAPNMIELAKKNNPTANFMVMDSRNINQFTEKFDAIIAGFCWPYLSEKDSAGVIFDAKNLLQPNGLMYISFVEGHPEKSDYQTGSSGDRIFFYYHQLETLKTQLKNNGFGNFKVFEVSYKKSETQQDTHTIVIGWLKV